MTTHPEQTMTWWGRNGYLMGREIGGGIWICLAPVLFTWRLMLCTPDSVLGFACYDHADLQLAVNAYTQWDGQGVPLAGYLRTVNLETTT